MVDLPSSQNPLSTSASASEGQKGDRFDGTGSHGHGEDIARSRNYGTAGMRGNQPSGGPLSLFDQTRATRLTALSDLCRNLQVSNLDDREIKTFISDTEFVRQNIKFTKNTEFTTRIECGGLYKAIADIKNVDGDDLAEVLKGIADLAFYTQEEGEHKAGEPYFQLVCLLVKACIMRGVNLEFYREMVALVERTCCMVGCHKSTKSTFSKASIMLTVKGFWRWYAFHPVSIAVGAPTFLAWCAYNKESPVDVLKKIPNCKAILSAAKDRATQRASQDSLFPERRSLLL